MNIYFINMCDKGYINNNEFLNNKTISFVNDYCVIDNDYTYSKTGHYIYYSTSNTVLVAVFPFVDKFVCSYNVYGNNSSVASMMLYNSSSNYVDFMNTSTGSWGSNGLGVYYQSGNYVHASGKRPSDYCVSNKINVISYEIDFTNAYFNTYVNGTKIDDLCFSNIDFNLPQYEYVLFYLCPILRFSNIVISDEVLSFQYVLAKLPVSSVSSTMTYDSNESIYSGAANTELLANIDVSTLKSVYSSYLLKYLISQDKIGYSGELLNVNRKLSVNGTSSISSISGDNISADLSSVLLYDFLNDIKIDSLTDLQYGYTVT